MEGNKSEVVSVDWSPVSSFLLVSGSQDGAVRVWDIRKAGRSSLIKSFDWRQDHTSINKSNHSKPISTVNYKDNTSIRLSDQSEESYRYNFQYENRNNNHDRFTWNMYCS